MIVTLTVTYERHAEVRRLLEGFAIQSACCDRHIFVDNAGESPLRDLLEKWRRELGWDASRIVYLPNPGNTGLGRAYALGERWLLEHLPDAEFLWLLDDDAVLNPDSLVTFRNALKSKGAGMCAPAYFLDRNGKMTFEVVPRSGFWVWKLKRQTLERQRELLPEVFQVPWSRGVSQLMTVEALRKVGTHREGVWMMGEDIEFSHRVAYHCGHVAVRDTEVGHYTVTDGIKGGEDASAIRLVALLQNLGWLAVHGCEPSRFWISVLSELRRMSLTYRRHPVWVLYGWLACLLGMCGVESGRKAGAWIRGRIED